MLCDRCRRYARGQSRRRFVRYENYTLLAIEALIYETVQTYSIDNNFRAQHTLVTMWI